MANSRHKLSIYTSKAKVFRQAFETFEVFPEGNFVSHPALIFCNVRRVNFGVLYPFPCKRFCLR